MRAQDPDREGAVDRDGVEIHYEVYGAGTPTLLLIPPSPITHSRIWKALIPFLARHYRVVTLDGRGNGKSGRPVKPDEYSSDVHVADLLAVLDATETPSAVVVALCHANWWAVSLAAAHPDRVEALIAIEPGVPHLGTRQPHWEETAPHWDEIIENPTGWQLNNRHVIHHPATSMDRILLRGATGRASLHQAVRRRRCLGA